MKTNLVILLAALSLAGCATNRGGTGSDIDTGYGRRARETPVPPTDFGRGGNRANPPPFDTQSGAFLPESDGIDLHGMESGKFPPATPPR